MGAWGALHAQRVSNRSVPSGQLEKGVAEPGDTALLRTLPFPVLSLHPQQWPLPARRLLQ